MVQKATNTFYNRTGEGGQGSEKGEKERDEACPDAGCPPRKPYGKPWVLKNKVPGKCLIYKQAGLWAKECPNHDRSPKIAYYKCHQLGHWMALCPCNPRASKSSAKPSLMMVQQDWRGPLQPARLSQTTITGLEPRVQMDVADRSKNFLVEKGATYSVLTSCSRAFSVQNCTTLAATGKAINKKIHMSTSLFLGWTNIFPSISSDPWVSNSLIEKRSFPAFKIL